ncbi:nitrate reductase cytochrome c-type subunit [Vibrio cincinnatiensis]|uniref:nitrate reductase cytochrome c-type subunit n=1 Tax=Vibrio cincinnatiensis TaxID=675 RepID=UPI001EDFEEC5|nr:nitrate reductase cytochrome c-type subunit [Vibrio cincinnatiensis]MCG3729175.1 nitrate reductase cytochrome c-type subunit [Vibrio cincinnatiensis]MCG3767223.1 nitrate reductase cytochrome c-type subunit [Vibrio cincinnatiensis]
MKKVLVGLLVLGAILTGIAKAELDTPLGLSSLESLRGMTDITETPPAEEMKRLPREQVLDADFVYQPPLIPHDIRNYEVSLNANKCLSCHSWKNAKVMGATKISVTHFVDREDAVLADVSPRRYFCLQCHVPQTDAKPLVENRFKSVDALN